MDINNSDRTYENKKASLALKNDNGFELGGVSRDVQYIADEYGE